MPAGFLDKLNVLVRSSLNTFLDDVGSKPSQPGRVPAERLGGDIDQEVAELRKRIDEALTAEDGMKQRLDEVNQRIGAYDQQADSALQRSDDVTARGAVQQMQRLQQQASMMQADLEQHRRSTSEFIERVNTLDAMISDARRQKQEEAQAQAEPDRQEAPETTAETMQPIKVESAPVVMLSGLLREARERVEGALSGQPAESAEPVQHIKIDVGKPPADPNIAPPAGKTADNVTSIKVNDAKVDEDLARRRSRLSKPE